MPTITLYKAEQYHVEETEIESVTRKKQDPILYARWCWL